MPGPCELIFGMATEVVTELIGGILGVVLIFGELELVQSHMAQKPVLRGEVG